jgi:hypothetical protein
MHRITKDVSDKELKINSLSDTSFVIPFILIPKIAKNAEEPKFLYRALVF